MQSSGTTPKIPTPLNLLRSSTSFMSTAKLGWESRTRGRIFCIDRFRRDTAVPSSAKRRGWPKDIAISNSSHKPIQAQRASGQANVGSGITKTPSKCLSSAMPSTYSCTNAGCSSSISNFRRFLCSFPGTSFCLSNFLSGSIPPKSTKRNRLARRLRENEFANRANKNGAEDELFFVGLFFNHHFWAFPDKLRKSRFFFPRARKGHES